MVCSYRSAPMLGIDQAAGIGDEEDNAFKRHDPMCAARPLSDHDIERERTASRRFDERGA